MTPTGRHPRWVVAVTAVLLTAGCTGGGGSEPRPTPAGSPPASAATPRTDPAVQPEYPTEPQEYAERTVAAWAAPDLLRLARLAAPEVHEEIVELPGPPDLTWRLIDCRAGPDGSAFSDCAFYNQDGDRLVLTVDHRRLGEPRAAVAMVFEVTDYPDQPLAYLEAFVAAWRDGNLARMQNLAAPGAVEVFAELPPVPEVSYRVGEPGGPLVEVVVQGLPRGDVTTAVSAGLLGQPQAIRTATLDPATG